MRRLELPAKLIISHAAGDEGTDYEQHIREYAHLLDVTVRFKSDQVQDRRGTTKEGKKIYVLGDVYPHADLVTYPSSIEGFGNAFLEAVYYRRPILVNNYSIYEVDIKPKGFRVVWFDGFISKSALEMVRQVLQIQRGHKNGRKKIINWPTIFFFYSIGALPAICSCGLFGTASMNIALLHYSVPPIVGGVESVIAHHPRLMSANGHSVRLVAGRGEAMSEKIPLAVIPLADSRHVRVTEMKKIGLGKSHRTI